LTDANARLAAENAALAQLARAAQSDLERHMHGTVDACRICAHVRCKGDAMPCVACRGHDAWAWDKAPKITKEDGK
jgi:hypothetical protein